MKRLDLLRDVALTLAVVACVFVFNACENEEVKVDGPPSLEIPSEFEWVGMKHNEGMDYIFSEICSYYESPSTKTVDGKIVPLGKEDLLSMTRELTVDFCALNDIDFTSEYKEFLLNMSPIVSTKAVNDTLKPEINEYMVMIDNVLSNEPSSESELTELLNNINNLAGRHLSEIDAMAIYSGTATCLASYVYWKDNYLKWLLLLNFPELLEAYGEEGLSQFKVIDGRLVPPSLVETKAWYDDVLDWTKDKWDNVTETTANWWTNGGKQLVAVDANGAVQGAIGGAVGGAATGGVLSGPAIVGGALGGGVAASVGQVVQDGIEGSGGNGDVSKQ